MKIILTAILILFGLNSLLLSAEPISASSVKWTGVFGGSEAAPRSAFCLMARGFFQMPTSPEMPGLIETWIRAHPKAVVITVATSGPITDKDPDSKLSFVWIVDGEENLNLALVRDGCFAPQTQTIGKNHKLEVSQADYEAFVKKALDAGKQAAEKKLGVWKE
jgi:hypothetical protein